MIKKSIELSGRTLTLETGRLAKQAGGSVLVTYGETVVPRGAAGPTRVHLRTPSRWQLFAQTKT